MSGRILDQLRVMADAAARRVDQLRKDCDGHIGACHVDEYDTLGRALAQAHAYLVLVAEELRDLDDGADETNFAVSVECPTCGGNGLDAREATRCVDCHGHGLIEDRREYDAPVIFTRRQAE